MLQSSPNLSSSSISLKTDTFEVSRSGLRTWLILEDYVAELSRAVETQNIEDFLNAVCFYISTAIGIQSDLVENVSAFDVINALETCIFVNKIKIQFPILGDEKKHKVIEPSWEYSGRSWYFWVHLLASAYGWTMEYVAKIDPEDAIGLLQEISLNDNLEKEWQWGLSEIAYPYNPNTKKQEFKAYPRPEWMANSRIIESPKNIKIRKDFLPIGNVISLQHNDKNIDTQRVL